MNSRETILSAVKANQPEMAALPDMQVFNIQDKGSLEKFAAALQSVGGNLYHVADYEEINRLIFARHGDKAKIVSPINELNKVTSENLENISLVHELHDVDVAILKARFGVAENGAVWITDDAMKHRALPFVCQHFAVIIDANAIVDNMHQAYELIGETTYGFGTFIAGPSKTADIEQSLVIGAHGPRSMTVFVLSADDNQ